MRSRLTGVRVFLAVAAAIISIEPAAAQDAAAGMPGATLYV